MQTYFLDQTHSLNHLLVWFSYHACGFWFCLFGIRGSVSLFSFQIQTQRGKEICFQVGSERKVARRYPAEAQR